MKHSWQIYVSALLLLVKSGLAADKREGDGLHGSIVARDTDTKSDLRQKLERLNNLLSRLENGEENVLQNLASKKKLGADSSKIISENMGSEQENRVELKPSVPPTIQKQAGGRQAPDEHGKQDNSIQILSKALARLRDSNVKDIDTTGEYLKTENNEVDSVDEKTKEMESLIERALTRLSEGKTDEIQDRSAVDAKERLSDKGNSGYSAGLQRSYSDQASSGQETSFQDKQLRNEGLRVIEARLMEDISLANNLGLSVDDIIQDLERKAEKETELEKLEEQLNKLKPA